MPKKKTKILAVSLFILDIVLISIFFSVYSYMNNQVRETTDKEDTITNLIKQQESVSLMKKDLGNGGNYQDQLYGYVLKKESVVSFIKTLEELAATSSLSSQINSVTFETGSMVSSINAELARFKMNVSGEWKNVIYFLKLLENYPLKIRIDGLSTTKTASGKWSADFNFTVVKFKDI